MDFKNTIKLILFILIGALLLTAAVLLLPFILLGLIIFMLLPNHRSKPLFASAKERYSKFKNAQQAANHNQQQEASQNTPPASEDIIDVVAKEVDNSD